MDIKEIIAITINGEKIQEIEPKNPAVKAPNKLPINTKVRYIPNASPRTDFVMKLDM